MPSNTNPFFRIPKKIYYFVFMVFAFLIGIILLIFHVPIGIHVRAFHINKHTVSVPVEYQDFFKVNQYIFLGKEFIKIKNMVVRDNRTVYLYLETSLRFKQNYSIQISKKHFLPCLLRQREKVKITLQQELFPLFLNENALHFFLSGHLSFDSVLIHAD